MTFSTSLCIKPFSSRRPRRFQQDDPSSPKVGCLGQVRRRKAAEKAAAPLLPPPPHSGGHRFYILMATVGFLVSPMNSKKRPRTKKPAPRGRRVMAVEEIEAPLPVAVEEMDPPLPVAVVGKKEREIIKTQAMSLWNRRCSSRKLDELFLCRQEKLPVVIAGIVV
ncbi:hypothetical protein MA16_Dca004089 [Dendrobium catenatum]|uniref:Uncharacterized protein n=1 Tax=Dendrobium catenatum TaxID=906689 RepID=A0A2I0X2E7_9ASPA|nr:hypothetical protein MA16_Dca004089 [Dendrobium catenatum]